MNVTFGDDPAVRIPETLSLIAPAVPIAGRVLIVAVWPRAAWQYMKKGATRRDEHRSIIFALAGFTLAGIAVIATQPSPKAGAALFDLTLGFLLYLASVAVQAWKARWWQDLLGDGFRDAGTTAMLLFVARLASGATGGDGTFGWPEWQPWVVGSVAGLVWLLDPAAHLVMAARNMCGIEGGLDGKEKRATGKEVRGEANPAETPAPESEKDGTASRSGAERDG